MTDNKDSLPDNVIRMPFLDDVEEKDDVIRLAARRPRLPRMPKRYIFAAVLLAVLMFAMNIPNLRGKSITVDEYAHLPAGYVYIKYRNFAMYNKNPPLIKMIAALPLMAIKPVFTLHDMYGATGSWGPWQFADAFVRSNRGKAIKMWAAGRVMIMLMGVALAVVVFLWAAGLYGPRAGLLAMFLTVTSPNILAHSGIVTTDLGFTLFFVLTFYLLWRFFEYYSGWALFLAAICFGAAQLSKFSALIMIPILILMFAALFIRLIFPGVHTDARRGGRSRASSFRKTLNNLIFATVIIFIISLVMINLGYFGKRTFEPLAGNSRKSAMFKKVNRTFLGSWRAPLPANYVIGLDAQMADAERGEFPNYINGEWRRTGVWYYFLEAMALKVPLPALVLIVFGLCVGLLGAVMTLRRRKPKQIVGEGQPTWPFVHLPAFLFLLTLSLFGNLQLGLRYVLPVLPLAFIAASRAISIRSVDGGFSARPQNRVAKIVMVVVAVLCIWQAVELVRTAPDYLSHFNQIAGGSEKGHNYLIDSNIDWGQDLPGLKKEMDALGIEKIGLLYFGHADPGLYGIKYRLPRRGDDFVAVSVNFLHRYPYALTYLREWRGRPPMVMDKPNIGAFKFAATLLEVEPAVRIGGSIYLYDLRLNRDMKGALMPMAK